MTEKKTIKKKDVINMSSFTYTEILKQARTLKTNVEKEQKMGMNSKWAYYFAKAIKKPHTNIKKINFNEAQNPTGDYISQDIQKANYLDMAKRLIQYVETNKKMPNYITVKNKKVIPRLVAYCFAKQLDYYDKNGKAPKYINFNSKAYTKQTETNNEIYNYFKKTFGDFGDTIDGALSKIAGNGYGYYYDDVYSNKTSIDRMANGNGVNCTDSCHVFYNILTALIEKGKYKKVECLHIGCSGGDGHVRLRITLNDGDYIYRDPAAVLSSGSITYNWCSNGTLWAINPSWFMDNLHR